ncbi:MAG: 30S ribosomal protein S12 methylthiotransferase RimO [Firmicutes bacterium]|nr:30S ribosomal protein S12 methylthiotransferase RimO [Bacillota bacterium]
MPVKVGFISLGCPKNRVDSEIMLGCLRRAQYELTGDIENAEIIVVNTCGFITAAKEESIAAILEAARFKETGRCRSLLVAGCLAQRYGGALLEEMPEIDGVMGTGSVPEIISVLNRMETGARPLAVGSPLYRHPGAGSRVLTTPGHTAYIKIAEGCDSRCSYCAIPDIRGPYRSRPQEDIVAEARDLCDRGARELIIVAQETTRYGIDLSGRFALVELLAQIEKLPCRWIRLMYCHPDSLTDELVALLAGSEKICRYIDIPLQHASKRVLQLMNRKGSRHELLGLVRRLRRSIPGLTLRTTFLVGFPGETEAEFQELMDFMTEARFERAGVFGFSPEEGTPAASLPGQLDELIIKERVERAMILQQGISLEHNRALIGRELAVLVEGWDDGQKMYRGRGEGDAPEIDGRVYFASRGEPRTGGFVRVRVLDAGEYDLSGVQVE